MAKLLRSLLPSRPAARPSVARGEGWVRPHWLERAGGQAVAGPTNEDQRRWTVIGSVDSPHQARVDVRGLVQLDGRAWSLDWWIGAEDRWHVPAREEVRSEERRVGEEWVRTFSTRWPLYHYTKNASVYILFYVID